VKSAPYSVTQADAKRDIKSDITYFINHHMTILSEYYSTYFIPKNKKDEVVEWPSKFWILTACNPYSSSNRDGDRLAMKSLRRELSSAGHWKLSLTAISADWSHCEKSFAVGSISKKEALSLGKKYHQNAIFLVEKNQLSVISCESGKEEKVGDFYERLRVTADRPAFRIYVIRLSSEVHKVKRFRDANPNYIPGKPCYYVGMTGRTPKERFEQHLAGYKSCSLVKKYGQHLAKKKLEGIPLLCHADAVRMEVSHAENLRAKGFAVWQK
jgi:hypothetical protein